MALSMAQTATRAAAPAPNMRQIARENGALERPSSFTGARPMMAVVAAMNMTAAMATPAIVAIGTLRLGLRTTDAATSALSMPVKAQKISSTDACVPASRGRPVGFQLCA